MTARPDESANPCSQSGPIPTADPGNGGSVPDVAAGPHVAETPDPVGGEGLVVAVVHATSIANKDAASIFFATI